jgi:hypothetical protein
MTVRGLGLAAAVALVSHSALADSRRAGGVPACEAREAAATAQAAELTEALAAAQSALEAKQAELEATQGQLTEAQGQLEVTQGQLTETQGQLEATQGQLEATQGQLATAQQQLQAAEGDAAACHDDLQQCRAQLPPPDLNLVPKLTANNSAAPIVVSSSTAHWNQDLQPWKAFNRSYSDWPEGFCLNGQTGWLTVDFGAATTVGAYTIRPRDDNGDDILGSNLKTFTFEGSNNGQSWTLLDSQTNLPAWQRGTIRSFEIAPSTYRYFRVNVSANYGYEISCFQELELLAP